MNYLTNIKNTGVTIGNSIVSGVKKAPTVIMDSFSYVGTGLASYMKEGLANFKENNFITKFCKDWKENYTTKDKMEVVKLVVGVTAICLVVGGVTYVLGPGLTSLSTWSTKQLTDAIMAEAPDGWVWDEINKGLKPVVTKIINFIVKIITAGVSGVITFMSGKAFFNRVSGDKHNDKRYVKNNGEITLETKDGSKLTCSYRINNGRYKDFDSATILQGVSAAGSLWITVLSILTMF